MLSEELLRRVRQIEITTRRMVDDVMSGRYRTHFKGQGVQFSEHRLYVPGDDVRHIDWKVSARSRDPLIKKYEEERELTVLLVVDLSASGAFGSGERLKAEVAAQIGGMLAYAATHTGDKVGVLIFAGEVEKVIPPGKGRNHVLRVVRDLLAYEPRTRGTDLAGALESARRVMKHGGIVFVVSDFLLPEGAREFATPLRRLARKHDVVAVRIADPREAQVPDVGRLPIVDPETGVERIVDTGSYAFRRWFADFRKQVEARQREAFRGSQVEELPIDTQEDYGEAVVRFFRARSRRRR